MDKAELERVRDWAVEKISHGSEPPWAWYQYMKLREALDAILGAQGAAMPQTANSPPAEPRSERRLRLVGSEDLQDTAQHHPSDEPVQLPM